MEARRKNRDAHRSAVDQHEQPSPAARDPRGDRGIPAADENKDPVAAQGQCKQAQAVTNQRLRIQTGVENDQLGPPIPGLPEKTNQVGKTSRDLRRPLLARTLSPYLNDSNLAGQGAQYCPPESGDTSPLRRPRRGDDDPERG